MLSKLIPAVVLMNALSCAKTQELPPKAPVATINVSLNNVNDGSSKQLALAFDPDTCTVQAGAQPDGGIVVACIHTYNADGEVTQ